MADEIKIGDIVRSQDHESMGNLSYVEGLVVDIQEMDGCVRYMIYVHRDVFQGKDVGHRCGQHVFPPVNGTPTLSGRIMDGVRKVF